MGSDTFYIKEGGHFKLWLQLKDKIAFEAELTNDEIPFHIDDNQSTLGSDIRYFLPDEYRERVDVIIKHIGISASTDTIVMYDVEDRRKIQKLYLAVVLAVVGLLIVATLCFGCKKNNEKENQYFSNFDEVVHYQINDTIINEIWTKRMHKEVLNETDSLTMWFVNGWREGGSLDKKVESRLSQTKFVMRPLDTTYNSELREIFKENRIAPIETTACEPTFRDILIFKNNNKAVGMAKLCLECSKSEFAGAKANTNNFGTKGEFARLRNIFKSYRMKYDPNRRAPGS
jgi:hypothetical protein